MYRKKVIIIGAGLAASVLYSKISLAFDVTIITSKKHFETTGKNYNLKLKNNNSGGLGGTTKLWHNALIKIDPMVFEKKPNFYNFYNEAYKIFGLNALKVDQKMLPGFGQIMAVPRKRLNMWKHLKTTDAKVIYDHIKSIETCSGEVVSLIGESGSDYKADLYIDCSGGLGSINHLAEHFALREGNKVVTESYEDHLCAYVAAVTFKQKQKVFSGRLTSGWSFRRPLVGIMPNGKRSAFYFRPTLLRGAKISPRALLTQVRNGPNRLAAVRHLIFNPSEIFEAITSRLGIPIATKKFEVFAVLGADPTEGHVELVKNRYRLAPQILPNLDKVVEESLRKALLEMFDQTRIDEIYIYENIRNRLDTGAHHSATFPADINGKYFDQNYRSTQAKNFFAVSGAQLYESGYSNTGLSICAMALELGAHLNEHYS